MKSFFCRLLLAVLLNQLQGDGLNLLICLKSGLFENHLFCHAHSICTRTPFRTCAKHRLWRFWRVSLMEARRSQPPSGRSSFYLSGTAASPSALGVNVQTHCRAKCSTKIAESQVCNHSVHLDFFDGDPTAAILRVFMAFSSISCSTEAAFLPFVRMLSKSTSFWSRK